MPVRTELMRRIVFRVWTAVSVCWIGAWSWYYQLPSCAPMHEGEQKNWAGTAIRRPRSTDTTMSFHSL